MKRNINFGLCERGQMSDCFKSFSTKAEILIFAAQEHQQYSQSER